MSLPGHLYPGNAAGNEKGELLQVIADCPAAFRNVPEEVVKHGYTLEREPVKNGRELLFYIRA